MLGAKTVEVGAGLTPEVEDMLEAGVPDVRNPGAAPLEERIRRDRRAVREARDPGARPTARAAASTDSSCRPPSAPSPFGSAPSSTSTASVNVPPTSTPRIATCVLCTGVGLRALPLRFRRADHQHPARPRAPAGNTSTGSTATSCRTSCGRRSSARPTRRSTRWRTSRSSSASRSSEALNERRYAHEIALIEAEELRPGIATTSPRRGGTG